MSAQHATETPTRPAPAEAGDAKDLTAEVVYAWPPATSWNELEALERGAEVSEAIQETCERMAVLMQGIRNAPDLTPADRVRRLVSAAGQFGARLEDALAEAEQEKAAGEEPVPILARLAKRLTKAVDPDACFDVPARKAPAANDIGAFKTFDTPDGPRWLGVWTNNYRDREGEVFPASSHKAFESYVDQTGSYPELRLFHIKGTRIGGADWLTYDDATGFFLASGAYDPGLEYVAGRLKALGPLGLSHGYRYPDGSVKDGVYGGGYITHEISVLPLDKAANAWTGFFAGEGDNVSITKEKRAFITGVLGEAPVAALEKALADQAQLAKVQGIGSKELGDAIKELVPEPAPAPVAAKSAEAPVTFDAEGLKGLITAAVTEANAPLAEKVAGIGTQLDAMAERVGTLEGGAEAVIAKMITPRAQPGGGFSASESAETKADGRAGDVKAARKEIESGEGWSAQAAEHLQPASRLLERVLSKPV